MGWIYARSWSIASTSSPMTLGSGAIIPLGLGLDACIFSGGTLLVSSDCDSDNSVTNPCTDSCSLELGYFLTAKFFTTDTGNTTFSSVLVNWSITELASGAIFFNIVALK